MLFKKWFIPVSASVLLVGEIIFFSLTPGSVQDVNFSGNINFEPPYLWTGPLTSGRSVVQSFQVDHDDLTKINLFVATYDRTNTSLLEIQLSDETKIIVNKKISAKKIKNNAYLEVDFPTIPNSAGKSYTITIKSPDATEQSGITTRYSSTPLPDSQLKIDGNETVGTLFIIPHYQASNWYKLGLLASRVNINKGGYVPPVILYLSLTALCWMINAWLVSAVQFLLRKNERKDKN